MTTDVESTSGKPAWLIRRQTPDHTETVEVLFDRTALNARVVDMSADGMRVRLASPQPFPERVHLKFSDGEVFPAERRWQHSEEVGLCFVSEEEAAELTARMSASERAALAALIATAMEQD
jgi:hypothetical protein